MPLLTDNERSKFDDDWLLNPLDNPELELCPTDGGLTESNPLFIDGRSNSLGDSGFGMLIRFAPRFCCDPGLVLKLVGDNRVGSIGLLLSLAKKSKFPIFPGIPPPFGDIKLVNRPVLALPERAGDRGPLLLALPVLEPNADAPNPLGAKF